MTKPKVPRQTVAVDPTILRAELDQRYINFCSFLSLDTNSKLLRNKEELLKDFRYNFEYKSSESKYVIIAENYSQTDLLITQAFILGLIKAISKQGLGDDEKNTIIERYISQFIVLFADAPFLQKITQEERKEFVKQLFREVFLEEFLPHYSALLAPLGPNQETSNQLIDRLFPKNQEYTNEVEQTLKQMRGRSNVYQGYAQEMSQDLVQSPQAAKTATPAATPSASTAASSAQSSSQSTTGTATSSWIKGDIQRSTYRSAAQAERTSTTASSAQPFSQSSADGSKISDSNPTGGVTTSQWKSARPTTKQRSPSGT